jgi:hypothetical protein
MSISTLESVGHQFAAAAGNPLPLVVCVAAAAFCVWKFAGSHLGGRITALEERLKFRDDKISELEKQQVRAALSRSEPERPKLANPREGLDSGIKPTPPNLAPPDAGKVVAEPPRVYVLNRSHDEIMDSFENLTTMQADVMAAPYIGKWIKVRIKVADVIGKAGDAVVLARDDRFGARLTWLRFKDGRGSLELLRLGDEIEASGRIDELNWLTLRLNDCSLLGKAD